ncbi:hypothetical protein [Sanguibacter sp. Leaf3]|uniref:hypothetical protein n=1 Tax=Sanguibacter sp. Leaf3 TaxID=1736209 RepID=UPI0006F9328F|nr:hypothetical protein [Sanguibacter sp. Leaf3]KQT96282.1 hypothetical protein ASG53_14215 [Sanguibacter sp. Leaf3]
MNQPPRSGRTRLALAGAALVPVLVGVAITTAAYTDRAVLTLGTGAAGSGLGNPARFDIAVRGSDSLLHDGASPQEAVALTLENGSKLSESSPVDFEVVLVNRAPGVSGDLILAVYDPDPVAADLFDALRFTVYLDGAPTPVLADAPPAQVVEERLAFEGVAPGEERLVTVSVLIAEGSGLDVAGKSTQIGLLVDGQSR